MQTVILGSRGIDQTAEEDGYNSDEDLIRAKRTRGGRGVKGKVAGIRRTYDLTGYEM
jgi:hypothetical protein